MQVLASAVFVGRERELEELERALEAARAGDGTTVLVAGEAGIGKTRIASELAARAREAGFEVLVGHSIDLVGTELPYQPFVDALRPLGALRHEDRATGSQLRAFEETLALLTDRAAEAPLLLVLEDLHWADTSTLDLVVFLAHNLDDQPILLLATCRGDEPASSKRMRGLAGSLRRSGSALVLELGPLNDEELAKLLSARADQPLSAALTDAIEARSEGNPFFAEELLAASDEGSADLPQGLRDLLLLRVSRLDDGTQDVLRLAAAVGREVRYPLLHATADLTDRDLRESLRASVEAGVLVAEPETNSFRFRHALLAEAVYSTILPGEREELHAHLAEELARSGAAAAGELAPHWAAAGRSAEALANSVKAAHEAEAVFGLAEALIHLERALALWDTVPNATELAGSDLAAVCARTARLASQVGASTRAIELSRRAIEIVGADDAHRAATLHVALGEYLYEVGRDDAGFAELQRAVEIAPAGPASPERAYALASLAGGLMLAWRYEESLETAEQALALASAVGAGEAEVRAVTVLALDLAYTGRADEGVALFRRALQRAGEIGDHWGLERVYINFTDALTMLGRPRESARLGQSGLEEMRRLGVYSPVLTANVIEALHWSGDWDEAERLSAAALRGITASFPYALFIARALVEIGRGEFDAARVHLEAGEVTLREDRGLGLYDSWLADFALWEHRWADAEAAVDKGLAHARRPEAAQIRLHVCANGLRTQAELAGFARARRDDAALRERLDRTRTLLTVARDAAAEASAIAPNAAGWLALVEAEYARTCGESQPEAWSKAATTWDRLERTPLAAYCRWREAEALVAAGASRTEASVPLREAHAAATRMGAKPLIRELELLAERARLDLAGPDAAPADENSSLADTLGLTPRESEVLTLVSRGYTNREIAEALVISVKTAGVHVSHILQKLDAPNRREAAAIAHRLAPPHDP